MHARIVANSNTTHTHTHTPYIHIYRMAFCGVWGGGSVEEWGFFFGFEGNIHYSVLFD